MYGSDKAKSNPFVIGTKKLKLEAIRDHESSKSHAQTVSCKVGKSALPQQTPAVKTLTSMKTAQLERMKLLFPNVHAIFQSLTLFVSIIIVVVFYQMSNNHTKNLTWLVELGCEMKNNSD